MHIGFVSTRFAGTDGVSLESTKWAEVLEEMGHKVFWLSGRSDRDPEVSLCVPEFFFGHRENEWITERIWGVAERDPWVTERIRDLAEENEKEVLVFVEDVAASGGYMIAVAGGNSLRCADYATFGTEALSVNMLKALEDRTACLLANHGMICFGASLEKALALAVEVETLCQQYSIASQSGKPTILDDAEMNLVIEKFKTYGPNAQQSRDSESNAVLPPEKLG